LSSPGGGGTRLMSAAVQRKASGQTPNRGALGPAARQALNQGYLVPNEAQYLRQKADAARRAGAGRAAPAAPAAPFAPTKVRAWAGINDTNFAPPDETGSVGTTRYVELVNSEFAIYNKTSNTPIATGAMNNFVGASSTDSVFDVQVIWDPTTNRFTTPLTTWPAPRATPLPSGLARPPRRRAPLTSASTSSTSAPLFPTSRSSATASSSR